MHRNYCDSNLMLLKMAIYAGEIPDWLDDEDRKALNAKTWRRIIADSESEGSQGFSGRDAIRIFGNFYSRYSREDRLITTPDLCFFFKHISAEFRKAVPDGFLTALLRMYEYQVLQQVKKALYYYNEEQIANDIKHYITAVNFENNANSDCFFNNEKLFITEEFMESIENRLKSDGKFLISNLENKFGYTRQGVREICIYAIDNNLSGKFR